MASHSHQNVICFDYGAGYIFGNFPVGALSPDWPGKVPCKRRRPHDGSWPGSTIPKREVIFNGVSDFFGLAKRWLHTMESPRGGVPGISRFGSGHNLKEGEQGPLAVWHAALLHMNRK